MGNIINHIEKHLNHLKADGVLSVDDDLAAIAWGVFALMHFETLCECHIVRATFKGIDKTYLEEQQA